MYMIVRLLPESRIERTAKLLEFRFTWPEPGKRDYIRECSTSKLRASRELEERGNEKECGSAPMFDSTS